MNAIVKEGSFTFCMLLILYHTFTNQKSKCKQVNCLKCGKTGWSGQVAILLVLYLVG